MKSSHRYFEIAVGVVFSILPMDINSYLSPFADRNIDMVILVDDFITFMHQVRKFLQWTIFVHVTN